MSSTGSSASSHAASPVAFSGTIEPTAISGSYRLGLALVTVAMILVPLLYLLLVAVVAWFVFWHLTTNTWIFDGDGGNQWRLLLYLTPAVVGSVLLFFMVKPILARRGSPQEPVQLAEADQPEVHALIRDVCRQVRAPIPSRVQVDCQVNASASLQGAFLGIFRRDVVLTIGLPLVTGLSVRQLSGVLAHEFGHFAQGGGMRMTAVIRGINFWLSRVVHERDPWDQKLEVWSKEGDWRIVIPMALARGSVWVSRQALAFVTMAGHGVSCYMLRQMEFDADSYEVKIAGSAAFASTVVRLRELSAGSRMAYSQVRHALDHHTIPADLPLLLAAHSRRLPDAVREQVHSVSPEQSRMFDTHPSDPERLAAANVLAAEGVLIGGDEPATALFRDFDRLSAAVTRHHYEHDLGIRLDDLRFVSLDETLLAGDERQRTDAAVHAFFDGRLTATRALRPQTDGLPTDLETLRQALTDTRAAMTAATVSEEDYQRFEHYQFRRDLAFGAEQLFLVGVQALDAAAFSLAEPTLAGAQGIQSWAVEEQDKLRPALDSFDALAARRLAVGALLCNHRGDADMRQLMLSVGALADAVPYIIDVRRATTAITFLAGVTPPAEAASQLRARIDSLQASADDARRRVLAIFSHAPPAPGEVAESWSRLLAAGPQLAAVELLQRVLELYWHALRQLARGVIEAEAEMSRVN